MCMFDVGTSENGVLVLTRNLEYFFFPLEMTEGTQNRKAAVAGRVGTTRQGITTSSSGMRPQGQLDNCRGVDVSQKLRMKYK